MRTHPWAVLPAVTLAGVVQLACKSHEPMAPSAPAAAPSTPASSSSTAPAPEAFATSGGELAMTPLKHASVLFRYQGKAVYVDPVEDAMRDGLPRADVILVTHTHGDHLSATTIGKLRQAGTQVVVPAAAAPELPQDGLVVLANGASRAVGPINVEAVPMYNLTRGPSAGKLFHDKGVGNGYVLTFGDKRVYLSGDTECTPEMKALQNIDVALVCMNLPYTMPPAEAAACINAFQPKILYPYHYRGSNLEELRAAVAGHGQIDVRLRNWYP
jgi:L-ascorbate metabolism protein UlaG (beta-lactamase superfamily)